MNEQRERSIETQLAVLNEMWETHTEQDMQQIANALVKVIKAYSK